MAALTSFAIEARYHPRAAGGYDRSWNPSRFETGSGSPSIMAFFHPSPFLVRATDPLLGAGGPLSRARGAVIRQLRSALKGVGVEIAEIRRKRDRHRPVWEIISGLDARAGYRTGSFAAWNAVVERGMKEAATRWHAADPPASVSGPEFDDIVRYAMGAPGVVLARSALRHAPGPFDGKGLEHLVKACWSGFRLYLDKSVFRARLPGKRFPEALLRAAVGGSSKPYSTSIFGSGGSPRQATWTACLGI